MTVPLRSLAFVPLALAAAAPAAAETWQVIDPQQDRKSVTVTDEGVTVTVIPGSIDDESDAAIEVRFPGLPPFKVPPDDYRASLYGISVGIGRLAPDDAAPTVLLAGYSGGAHCCATLQVISLVDGRPVASSLPVIDGAPIGEFPKDIDGDGVRDFESIDGSLLYAFVSYAGSWPVPRIFNLRRGEPVDVSRRPGFAGLYRDFAAEALEACRSGDSESAGPCAAYAYVRALQGEAEDGIRTAVRFASEPSWYPVDCTVPLTNDGCPAGREREFDGFEAALRWMMRENGYLP